MRDERYRPVVFVDIEGGPLSRAVKGISFGAKIADHLCDGEKEADIAVTDSIGAALRIVKETEQTIIVVVYFDTEQRKQALAFAARVPNRTRAMTGIPREGDAGFVPEFFNLIKTLAKEKSNENPAR
ncbi:MAG: hypothetical protein AAB539_01815 [Patescibacteria group bacterium]